MQLNQSDLELLDSKNIPIKDLEKQLETFKKGIPFVNIIDSARIGEGITKIEKEQKKYFIGLYDSSNVKVVKFTPASGAATRMFKDLHAFLNSPFTDEVEISQLLNKKEFKLIKQLIEKLPQLPFYKEANENATNIFDNFSLHSQLEQDVLVLKAIIDNDYCVQLLANKIL